MNKKEVQKLTDKWCERLGMQNFMVVLSFYKNKSKKLNGMVQYEAGTSRTNPSYKSIMINIDPRVLGRDSHFINETIVHELLHGLMGQYDHYADTGVWAKYFREQVVSELARIIIRLFRGNI